MTLTTFQPADIPAVLAFWRQQEGIGLSDSDSPDQLAAFLARNPGLSLVARQNDQIVAAVLCGHDGRRGYLHHLAVAPAHRRRGLGQKLVDACLQNLAALGIQKCNIFLFATNAAGQKFWTAQNFTPRPDLLLLQRPTPIKTPAPARRFQGPALD